MWWFYIRGLDFDFTIRTSLVIMRPLIPGGSTASEMEWVEKMAGGYTAFEKYKILWKTGTAINSSSVAENTELYPWIIIHFVEHDPVELKCKSMISVNRGWQRNFVFFPLLWIHFNKFIGKKFHWLTFKLFKFYYPQFKQMRIHWRKLKFIYFWYNLYGNCILHYAHWCTRERDGTKMWIFVLLICLIN